MSQHSYFAPARSGLWLPRRLVDRTAESAFSTYLQVKQLAEELEALFSRYEVRIDHQCGLGIMISAAKELSTEWMANSARDVPDDTLFRAAHLQNIAHVLLALARDTDIRQHLDRLRGAWDPLSANRTEAADFFWELQCLYLLRSRGLDAILREPPDIMVRVNDVTIGIACKKLHAENSGEKQLSKGVGQTERDCDFGIVAVNLNALYGPAELVPFASEADMRAAFDAFNLDFFSRQEHRIRQYMTDGRTLTAFASTGALVDLLDQETRLNVARWSTLWAIPELPDRQRDAMRAFKAAIESGGPVSRPSDAV